ncbi:MAG: response regulator [Bacteroidetes bacterium]|jgi:signal transduction histidine kinase|nr:response regulator [Bacteroidota bacterium]
MDDASESFVSIEPALLVATFLPTGRPVSRNDAWRHLLGASDEPWIHLQDQDRTLAEQCVSEAAQGALVTNQIFPVHSADRDEPLPVLLNFLPVHLPSDAAELHEVQAITVSGEVLAEPTSWTTSQTQRHRLEVLGRMTMGIAHEFNNLLSGILGYTQLLKSMRASEAPDTPSERSQSYQHLDTIEQAALDGAALIKRLQQFIRQEKRTRFEHVDLVSIVEDCVNLTRPYWHNEPRRQGITIDLELDLEEVPPLLGSATELREVLVNLVLNAVQAMPKGGTLALRLRHDEARGIWMTVEDTGMGMPESVREHIFEPLFTTKGERGTGMGLAVTHGIVQEHEGTIDVSSTPGEGTRFDITFPPATDSPPTPSGDGPAPDHVAARILMVDDEQMVRSVFAKLLSVRGHAVVSASSGAEGLQHARDNGFDIVFVDQAMPEMSGDEFARTLRTEAPHLPIVLLTGDADITEASALFNAILEKPFHVDEIEKTIHRLTQVESG